VPSRHFCVLCASLVLNACTASTPPSSRPAGWQLAAAESLYADLRDLRDRIDITLESPVKRTRDTTPLSVLIARSNELRRTVVTRLATIDSALLVKEDRRALVTMQRVLGRELDSLSPVQALPETPAGAPSCTYDARSIATSSGRPDSLRNRIYACYGWTQSHVKVGSDTLDRLTILGALGRSESSERRRALFLALDPVWRSMNSDNGSSSPYRILISQVMARTHQPPSLTQAEASGIPSDSLESWLLAILDAWRLANSDPRTEPWDWYFRTGQASRALSPRISRDRLVRLNDEVYRSLGADIHALGVHYDLDPREGKTPVAYTTFGLRPRLMNGSWRSGQPWVFATYRVGGLDNLNELIHETGHAIHIAAIRTRPAFADWPDSDPFTEAVADFIALEVTEPAWQLRWLGDSVPLAQGLRARYAGIVMDVAWALFELRMQRDPNQDPNRVWTDLTAEYLRIRPHPELSWWAMRGQLVDSPGYMMNYAVGAMLIAAIRERTRELHGPFTAGDSTWYSWIAPRLFRYGLERPSREVIEDFIGGPVSPRAILADMGRK
jgi:hypothetical protein